MGKPKNSKKGKATIADVSDNEDYEDTIDPSASDFIYDAVDEYYENEEREGAEKLAKLMKKPKRYTQEDVLGVASSSDEDETLKRSTKKKLKKPCLDAEPLPPLDSELEEDKEGADEEDNLEWGKKRSAYYNADYVDEEWDDANESDAEVAQLEEQEALAIQQRLAQQLEEADFGLDFITHLKAADKAKEHIIVQEEKIDLNLSHLSKREKLKLLTEESPELIELAEDFKCQMEELKNNIEPILELVTKGLLPPSPAVDYVKAKYHIILNYCTQIGYYFVLKSKRISVQNHPVVKRLVQFRSLLHQLENGGANLQPEIDSLLTKIKQKEKIAVEDFVHTVIPPRKKLRILSNRTQEQVVAISKQKEKITDTKRQKGNALTRDEEDALDFYKAVRKSKKDSEEDDVTSDEEINLNMSAGAESADNGAEEGEEESGKRGINYQIAKNKGLTPHRSKEQRNPRVKHRMKFRKAKIRRKGQIREPRKELTKYGGEVSGIKATVIRSVKLK
ncbi:something about silencing protein 10-like [Daphnia carinata]|uniref:something about silencing protein 10-like n=1 Tax=Daphnia carinata TaxID=120202 RepID=UPI002580266F|nr:something about silencing protein 10-like [Daphnia carinata]